MSEPPNKRIKTGEELVELIRQCYDLKFNTEKLTEEEQDSLKSGIQRIRETLEQTTSSSDVSFGATKTAAKINWGKCLGLLIEDGPPNCVDAIKMLTERLSPGGGLLG